MDENFSFAKFEDGAGFFKDLRKTLMADRSMLPLVLKLPIALPVVTPQLLTHSA